jgi:RNA polymerase sigma-70 factor (ECF subfamily)
VRGAAEPPSGPGPADAAPDPHAELLARARRGDADARNRLIGLYLEPLRRFARGRLPLHARDLMDTDDLVQTAVVRALNHLEEFEPRRSGAFLAYLRQIVMNRVRDAIRRGAKNLGREELSEDLPGTEQSPLEETIGRETLERYEEALTSLTSAQCEAVVLRIELGLSYPEIADRIGGSPNGARMLVSRGLVRLAERMQELRGPG